MDIYCKYNSIINGIGIHQPLNGLMRIISYVIFLLYHVYSQFFTFWGNNTTPFQLCVTPGGSKLCVTPRGSIRFYSTSEIGRPISDINVWYYFCPFVQTPNGSQAVCACLKRAGYRLAHTCVCNSDLCGLTGFALGFGWACICGWPLSFSSGFAHRGCIITVQAIPWGHPNPRGI